ncbi:MAG: hypothetical protein AAF741_02840 [Bacteroidota bacterium]
MGRLPSQNQCFDTRSIGQAEYSTYIEGVAPVGANEANGQIVAAVLDFAM